MAKDKIIGAVVMILGILIAIIYTMGSVVDLWFNTIGPNPPGGEWDADCLVSIGSITDYLQSYHSGLWFF